MTEYKDGERASESSRRSDARWRGAQALLALVRREPGLTRAAAARRLSLSTGSATELLARMRELGLLQEQPALPGGRGRPTTLLCAHPSGPLVAAVDLRHATWLIALAGVDGVPTVVREGRHPGRNVATVLRRLRQTIASLHGEYGSRLRAVSVAAPGSTRGGRLVQASLLAWDAIDLATIAGDTGLPVLVGNDATLAGLAEARSPELAGIHTVLHLVIEVGAGGVLIIGGEPAMGATGTGGEFGHMPMGDARLECPCGARGCWELGVDGRALARYLGEAQPQDPRAFAERVLASASSDARARRASERCAAAFGAGVAGLINALDPAVVTLGGLAGPLRAAAPDAFASALSAGLMTFRRSDPPSIRDAVWGAEGALRGAAAIGLDAALDAHGLDRWAAAAPVLGRAS